jgi:murein DD-endopeptidase MepM/ murein hydrolase activator NlpD
MGEDKNMLYKIIIFVLTALAVQVHMFSREAGYVVNESFDKHSQACSPTMCQNLCLELPVATDKFWVSSLYGNRKKPNGKMGWHNGVDFAAVKGVPVYAVAAGIVEWAEEKKGYGNFIEIKHKRKFKSRYAHLDKFAKGIKQGKHVKKGQLLGYVGATGNVRALKDPSHLHFEVLHKEKSMNPLCCLAQSPCIAG